MNTTKRGAFAGVGFLFLVLTAGSFFSQGCGDKTATGPVTVTEGVTLVATPAPSGVAGRDWNYTTLSAGFGARDSFAGVVYNNKMWAIGGYVVGLSNGVWSSTNGANWDQNLVDAFSPGPNQFSERSNHTALVFNNKIWIIGGFTGSAALNDVWSSNDGVSWTKVLADNASPGSNQFSQRFAHTSVVYDNKMWVIGGSTYGGSYLNDVWSSTDGVTWTNVLVDTGSPGSSQFSERWFHSCLVYNGQMWVIGGDNGAFLNDAWTSTDGISWTNYLGNNASPGPYQFSQRRNLMTMVYSGVMWVIGGENGTGRLNDVWYSSGGTSWTNMTLAAAFPGRASAVGLNFNNAMWLLGGLNSSGSLLGDVWTSPF